jgi:hypothetical protein
MEGSRTKYQNQRGTVERRKKKNQQTYKREEEKKA